MGVHISFVRLVGIPTVQLQPNVDTPHNSRSTTLDSWQLSQLRTMKVGGNAAATEFFTRNGAVALLSDSDVKKKYSGRVADLYKEELAKRANDDTVR